MANKYTVVPKNQKLGALTIDGSLKCINGLLDLRTETRYVLFGAGHLTNIEPQNLSAHLKEMNELVFERKWAMPSAWTFSIKPIKQMLGEEITDGKWIDPYAGENGGQYAQTTNDLARGGIDALEFLKLQPTAHFDGILLDPPYSLRQVSEHYKKAGIKITGWHTSAGYNSALKNEAARVLKGRWESNLLWLVVYGTGINARLHTQTHTSCPSRRLKE